MTQAQGTQLKITRTIMDPPGSYPDSSIIALHKLLRRLNGVDVPEKERLEAFLRHATAVIADPDIAQSVPSIVFFLGAIKDNGKLVLRYHQRGCGGVYRAGADRGIKITTIRTRLANIMSFLRYWMEEGIVSFEVFFGGSLQMPERLPRL